MGLVDSVAACQGSLVAPAPPTGPDLNELLPVSCMPMVQELPTVVSSLKRW